MELYFPGEERMEYSWVTPRLAVGRTIASVKNMWRLAADRVTHVLSLETEFDDSQITDQTGITVCWLPQPDDLQRKPPEWFEQGVSFLDEALSLEGTRAYVHCLAGIQRSPMMVLAYLTASGMELGEAIALIQRARPVAQFPTPYLLSVQQFLRERKPQV